MEDYNGDYYGWLTTTAQALADGRTSNVNLAQVAEELQDLSKTERRYHPRHFRGILIHLLKMRFQSAKHTRSWDLSVEGSRLELHELLRESPSLASEKERLMNDSYRSGAD